MIINMFDQYILNALPTHEYVNSIPRGDKIIVPKAKLEAPNEVM